MLPATDVYMEKPHYSLFCTFLWVIMQDSQVQSTSFYQRLPLRYILARRGDERERDLLCQVAVLPCPVQQNFTTTSQGILRSSMTSLVVHRSDSQKNSREWSANYYFQALYALPGSDMWYPRGIINISQNGHHFERRKAGREGISLAIKNSNYFSILLLSHPSHQTV